MTDLKRYRNRDSDNQQIPQRSPRHYYSQILALAAILTATGTPKEHLGPPEELEPRPRWPVAVRQLKTKNLIKTPNYRIGGIKHDRRNQDSRNKTAAIIL